LKHQFALIQGLIILNFVACGRVMESIQTSNPLIEDTPGTYRAILRPYNNQLSGWIPNGVAEINLSATRLHISSWIDDSASVIHQQYILDAEDCPQERHDVNQDGVIDIKETLNLAKSILVPLDADLSSPASGQNQFPIGDFTYNEGATISDVKNKNSKTIFNGKVIIVLGIAPDRKLPSTVSTFNSQTPQLSIPILCGKIQKVQEATR
jgi:hypothetical protein